MPRKKKPKPSIWPEPAPIKILEGVLPLLPPGVNEAYKLVEYVRTSGEHAGELTRRMGGTKKWNTFKRQAGRHFGWSYVHADLLKLICSPEVQGAREKEGLEISILFKFETLWRRDIDGGIKALIDSVCEGLGFNDRTFVDLHVKKRAINKADPTDVPRCEITITWLGKMDVA